MSSSRIDPDCCANATQFGSNIFLHQPGWTRSQIEMPLSSGDDGHFDVGIVDDPPANSLPDMTAGADGTS